MKAKVDCFPCFFRQAIEAGRLSGLTDLQILEVIKKLSKEIQNTNLNILPPEMGKIIHSIVNGYTGNHDPYRKIREKSIKFALKHYDQLKEIVEEADDKLLKAVELAIYGNVIDYGAKTEDEIERELDTLLNGKELPLKKCKTKFDYEIFKQRVIKSERLLYIGDNAGETVFDRILIEEIKNENKRVKIFYAVKERPIVNDAVDEDAVKSGIDNVANIVSSGSDIQGTILSQCKRDFVEIVKSSDLVIAKGQGNFESLNEEPYPIFFMLMAKCKVIANHLGCEVGDIILCKSKKFGFKN